MRKPLHPAGLRWRCCGPAPARPALALTRGQHLTWPKSEISDFGAGSGEGSEFRVRSRGARIGATAPKNAFAPVLGGGHNASRPRPTCAPQGPISGQPEIGVAGCRRGRYAGLVALKLTGAGVAAPGRRTGNTPSPPAAATLPPRRPRRPSRTRRSRSPRRSDRNSAAPPLRSWRPCRCFP